MIKQLYVTGYRSVKDISLKLGRVNVLIGPNGCGKSNLYRSMYLIASAANGQFAKTLADEGGMPSVLWAGQRSKGVVRITLEVWLDNLKYKLSCGLPSPDNSGFELDPEIKEEEISYRVNGKTILILERKKGTILARDADGKRITMPMAVESNESVLSSLREPHRFPEIFALRQEFLSWRFYHQFRTDLASPLRQPQVGVRTPIMQHDGSDLAAALKTIIGSDNSEALYVALELAFPGAELSINSEHGRISVALHMPGFQRPFDAKELSDGTLQYLCLLAALLSPRPPTLLALNEPETSLHPDLLESLAKLIARAATQSQLWITTHSQVLADFILEHAGTTPIELEKVDGSTRVAGQPSDNDDD